MEEGFSHRLAGVGSWLFLSRQHRTTRAHYGVHKPAKLPDIISEPEQPKQYGAGDLYCLGDPYKSAIPAVEQSGSRVCTFIFITAAKLLHSLSGTLTP